MTTEYLMTTKGIREKFKKWNEAFESKGLKVNLGITKVMVSSCITKDGLSFKLNIDYKSLALFLSLSCTPHIALIMDLSTLHKISISLSFRHHASIPYTIADFM